MQAMVSTYVARYEQESYSISQGRKAFVLLEIFVTEIKNKRGELIPVKTLFIIRNLRSYIFYKLKQDSPGSESHAQPSS